MTFTPPQQGLDKVLVQRAHTLIGPASLQETMLPYSQAPGHCGSHAWSAAEKLLELALALS